MPRIVDKKVMDTVLAPYLKVLTPRIDADMAKRLKEVRMRLRLTQAEMGERLGLRQSDMSRLENGRLQNIPLSAQEFKTVLDKHFGFVLFGGYMLPEDAIKWKKTKGIGYFSGHL